MMVQEQKDYFDLCGNDPHAMELLKQFRESKPQLEALENEVVELITQAFAQQDFSLALIEHRVKTEESLAGKLKRKGYKYKSISDITDLLGVRLITFYSDEVDKMAAIVMQLFDIDWKNSVDKRKMHDLNSFGYNSLHYVCRLHHGSIPFEIQMRTSLEHTWSAIEHDIGYKGIVQLPPEFRRQFSRLSGMLELIDDEFSRLRIAMTDYRRHMKSLVSSGRLDEVPLSSDSFQSYLELRPFDRLNKRIAAINQAELFPADLNRFLRVLETIRLETLGDVQRFIDTNSDDAFQLALSQLAVTDLDILSESIGIQSLCLVYVLKNGGGLIGMKNVLDVINGPQDANVVLAEGVFKVAQGLSFMAEINSINKS